MLLVYFMFAVPFLKNYMYELEKEAIEKKDVKEKENMAGKEER